MAGEGSRAFLDDVTVSEHDLHVYAHNPRALALYERLGYQATGLKMRKLLGAG